MGLERHLLTQRKKRNPLEGSFDYALEVFNILPTTCPHIGDRDFSCGRASVDIPASVSGIIGANGSGPSKAEVFVAAHQSNGEVQRQALILIQVGEKFMAFRIEGRSTIEDVARETDGEMSLGKIITNYRDIYLDIPDGDGFKSLKVEPGSPEHTAFKELVPLAEKIGQNPSALLCDGCAAKKYGLPGPVVG